MKKNKSASIKLNMHHFSSLRVFYSLRPCGRRSRSFSLVRNDVVSDVKIILAFGNYMNSSKRGAAYGFRLQSLDLVSKKRTEQRFYFCTHVTGGKISLTVVSRCFLSPR